jgi:type II secretory pathway pseudopilin PulG
MKTSIIAVLFAAAALPVAAQTTPRVDARQASQEARIQQGAQSGALTGTEAAKLDRGQDKVQAAERKAKADGKVTPRERARLAKEQNRQSRKIAKQKHDPQRKAPAS